MEVAPYTIWEVSSGEPLIIGSAVLDKITPGEGQKIYWGEKVNRETHIFDVVTHLPVLRTTSPRKTDDELLSEINRQRNRRIEEGRQFNGVWVSANDSTVMLALKDTARDLNEAGIKTPVLPFKDAKNVEHMLTAKEFIAIHNAAKKFITDVTVASWKLKSMKSIPQDVDNDKHWP
jgi:hypothetical protein